MFGRWEMGDGRLITRQTTLSSSNTYNVDNKNLFRVLMMMTTTSTVCVLRGVMF